MPHRVHRVEFQEGAARDELERVLALLTGEVVEIVPVIVPVMRPFGAAGRTKELLVVEHVAA